ncbi:MAG: disulfide bond formation protein B [Cardiobacteriaceae bacterium]|nr:disulfide bond formation protein B [Cardiobacteriaceae bacterium]
MTITDTHRRLALTISGLGAWASIAFAYYYLEKTLYLTPCNLCMMQRLAFALIGFFFLLDAACWPRSTVGRYLLRLFKYLSIFFGIGLAARHLYIQSLPAEEVPACGFDFYTMMDKSPTIFHGLLKAMHGDGDCAVPDTVFQGTMLQNSLLDLRIPVWSMILFVGLLLICVLCERPKKSTY